MSEISRSVQIVKHAKKKCFDYTVRTVHTDADMVGPYTNVAEPYADVAEMILRTGVSWTVNHLLTRDISVVNGLVTRGPSKGHHVSPSIG
jgi:hypothetical protein